MELKTAATLLKLRTQRFPSVKLNHTHTHTHMERKRKERRRMEEERERERERERDRGRERKRGGRHPNSDDKINVKYAHYNMHA